MSTNDFRGLGYDEGVDYSLRAMYLSTGIVNDVQFPVKKAMQIVNFAAHSDIDYRRAFSLALCTALKSFTAA